MDNTMEFVDSTVGICNGNWWDTRYGLPTADEAMKKATANIPIQLKNKISYEIVAASLKGHSTVIIHYYNMDAEIDYSIKKWLVNNGYKVSYKDINSNDGETYFYTEMIVEWDFEKGGKK